MIALDSSAIIAIVRLETEAARFSRVMSERTAIVSAPTLLETHMVLSQKLEGGPRDLLPRFLESPLVSFIDFTMPMLALAQDAFDRFGKGRGHPARLNFGDCLSYAVAKHHGIPLLFKGDDFRHTDIEPALQ